MIQVLGKMAAVYMVAMILLGIALYRAGAARERSSEAKRIRDAANDELARRRRGAA